MSYICSYCGSGYSYYAKECVYNKKEGVHVYVRKNSIPVCRYCCREGDGIFGSTCRNSPYRYCQSM